MQSPSPLSLANSLSKSKVFFRHAHWQGRRYCIQCKARKIYRLKDGRFKCSRCAFKFQEFTATYLENIQVPLNELAHLLYLFILGVPAYRCRQYVQVSLKTVYKVYTLFRQAIYDQSLKELKTLSGTIEMDEAMFGGKRKGKRGWGAAGKHLVFGIYQRNGKVITSPVPNRKTKTLTHFIMKYTGPGSLYYTDDWHAYTWLSVRGEHVVVKKEQGKPKAKGRGHLNSIEGFWSYAKNWFYQYRGIPHHHFHLYLKEIEFRFNHRNEDLFFLLAKLLTNLVPNRS